MIGINDLWGGETGNKELGKTADRKHIIYIDFYSRMLGESNQLTNDILQMEFISTGQDTSGCVTCFVLTCRTP
jgi:hypothetical protein